MTNEKVGEKKANSNNTLSRFPYTGRIIPITDRKIQLKTVERYEVLTFFDERGVAKGNAFPFYNVAGEFVAQKVKEFSPREGRKKRHIECLGQFSQGMLFGQQLFPAGGKAITITEGEEDCLSAYQMVKAHYGSAFDPAVVSIRSGASAAERDCKDCWEYINSFAKIVICFDGDAPGREAAEKVAKLFPTKAYVVKLDNNKDINDYLKEDRGRDFINSWHSAEKLAVKGVLEFSALWDAMTKEDAFTTISWPWEGLNKKTFGMRTTELSIIKAPPKIGKSQLLREVSFHIHETEPDVHVGVIFLEEGLKRVGLGFCGLKMNKPIHLPDTEYSKDELREAYKHFAVSERIHIFDPAAERSIESLFDRLMYFVQVCNCKVIFLDHISMFAYSALDTDERRFLDMFVDNLKNFAVQHNVHICAVIHVNDDGKTRGSRAPVQLCDLLISIERDKLNPDPVIKNTTTLVVEENRFSGDSGEACKLYYNPETGRMSEMDSSLEMGSQRGRTTEVDFDD
jgi:twinkle protein